MALILLTLGLLVVLFLIMVALAPRLRGAQRRRPSSIGSRRVSPEVEAQNEVDDVRQMIEAQNDLAAKARRRGDHRGGRGALGPRGPGARAGVAAPSPRVVAPKMKLARALIVGCGCRGRELGRLSSRSEAGGLVGPAAGRGAWIRSSAAGFEPAVADPDRPGTDPRALQRRHRSRLAARHAFGESRLT